MNARLRSTTVLALAIGGMFFAACDSDDPAETGRISGRYVAEVDVTEDATAPGADARAAGVCCFTMTLDLTSDADGAISGSGTNQLMDEEGNEINPPQPLEVTGTLEGNAVEMEIAAGAFVRVFEGTVSEDGATIAGSFEGLVGVPVVFERAP